MAPFSFKLVTWLTWPVVVAANLINHPFRTPFLENPIKWTFRNLILMGVVSGVFTAFLGWLSFRRKWRTYSR